MKTQIDVVVPMFNRAEETVRLMKSIRSCYGSSEALDVGVVLVDNGSFQSDSIRLAPYLGNPIRRTVRNSANLGFVRGTNQGVMACDAPFIVMQNNDTEVYPGLYESLLSALQDCPAVGAAGPISSETEHSWQSWDRLANLGVLDMTSEEQEAFNAHSHDIRAAHLRSEFSGMRHPVKTMLAFFCTLFRAEVFEKVGLLSTEFGLGLGDDDDYCARMRAAGYGLALCLDAYVRHAGRTTFKAIHSDEELAAAKARALEILRRKYGSSYGTEDPC